MSLLKQNKLKFRRKIIAAIGTFVKDSVLIVAKSWLLIVIGGYLASRLLIAGTDEQRFKSAENALPKFPQGTVIQREFIDIHGFGNESYVITASDPDIFNFNVKKSRILAPFVILDKRQPSLIDKVVGEGDSYYESLKIEPNGKIFCFVYEDGKETCSLIATKFSVDPQLKLVFPRWYLTGTSSGDVFYPLIVEWKGKYNVYPLPNILKDAGFDPRWKNTETFTVLQGTDKRKVEVVIATSRETLFVAEDYEAYYSTLPVRRLLIAESLWGITKGDSESHADPHRTLVGVYILNDGKLERDLKWNGGKYLIVPKGQFVDEEKLRELVLENQFPN